METTIESQEVINCRNAIVNIGLDDEKSCASLKLKTMTNKVEKTVVAQNGGLISDDSNLISNVRNNVSNGNVYINDVEDVVHYECAKHLNSVQLNHNFNTNLGNNNINSVMKEYNDCVNAADSEAVVITEEIGHELVISEEQVIYENTNEDESNIRTNAINNNNNNNNINDNNNNNNNNENSVCDEDMSESVIVNNNTNSENVVNVRNRFESSIDFDGENSSLSESSSQQSSLSQSQPTPINVTNNAMNIVESYITFETNNAITSHSSQLNDSTNVSSVSAISKKKFGKFRILGDSEQNRGCDENLNTENNDFIINSEENSIDLRFDRVGNAETLSGTQSESSLHDVSEHSSASPNASNTPSTKSSKQAKRRGRPAGSTKKDRTPIILPPQILLEDDLSRRRSSRLKTLEERREQEKATVAKHRDTDDTNANNNVIISDTIETTQQIDSSNSVKQKKKKSKKDKTKKEKNKESDSKKGKRKKKSLTAFDENKQKQSEDQKSEKCKMLESYKNVSNLECFTPPLPPSHYINIKSNLTLTPPSNKSATDSDDTSPRPEKVKSRWRRNSELESGHGFNSEHQRQNAQNVQIIIPKETEPPPPYEAIDENIYLFERRKSKSKKETRRMVCDCILTKEERMRGLIGCGDDCLNRMLMIECGSRCSLGDHCANKRFQKKQYAKVEPFRTAKKGWGLRALEPLQANTFIMEYIGEVVDPLEFHNRVEKYSKEKRQHHYFMALKSDEIIDATVKGNITRFVNHSCDPSCETQKWTVNGDLRIGFFTQRFVQAGEEITFDYQFQRYGKEAQKCYCESSNCRGYIGATETADIFTDGSRITQKQKSKIDEKLEDEEVLEDLALEEEIAKLSEGGGLRSRQQVLMLARLMVRAEDSASRIKLISIIKGTIEMAYLRLLLDYHGLQLIWSWMVEVEDIDLKSQILELLETLPIPNKTMLTDSKVYSVVERWSQQTDEESVSVTNNANTNETKVEITDMTAIAPENEIKLEQNDEVLNDTVCDTNEEITPEVTVKVELSETDKIENIVEENGSEPIKTLNDSEVETSATIINEGESAIKDVSKEQNETEPQITQENKENKEIQNDVQTPIKSSPRIELKNPLISLLIKPRSVINSSKVETQIPMIKSKPNIASMAQKLLVNWKELKEVFRIPRLERQKRHEDEKEADRRTKEVEERRARGLPISFDKRGIDDRDYTIAGILGIRRKGLKRTNDSKDTPTKKNLMSSLQSNNQISVSNAVNKISKEEHRKLFEMEVAQKDYQEALKRYHQELAYYNAMYGSHLQAQQLYSQGSQVHEPYVSAYNSYDPYYQSDQNYIQPSVCYSVQSEASVEFMSTESEQIQEYQEESAYIDENTIFSLETTPSLIPLANFDLEQTTIESSFAIDNVTNDLIDYKDDELFEQCTQNKSIFDAIHPPPGVFYVTPDGTNYFTPVPTDKKGVPVVSTVFDEGVIIPHSSTFTQTLANTKLPKDWRHHRDKSGRIYYYNKITRKSQWMPPEEEKRFSPVLDVPISIDVEQKLSDNEDSTSCAEPPLLTPSKHEEIDEPMDSCLDSAVPDSLNIIAENENTINSAHSSPILFQSIIAFEADPRRRKQLLNSVTHSTTTAAADTSTSTRKRTFSSTRKVQEHFRTKMSQYVIHCLNPYRKADCKQGRILNTEDFKYLARKLTHTIMGKEIKQCKSLEDLSCNEAVKHKTKDYVRKYMARFGAFYKIDNNDKVISPKDIAPNDTND